MADHKPEVYFQENQQHNKGSDVGLEKLDTLHGDEAVKVLVTYSGDETWTPQEEKKLRRKIDIKLLPVLCVTYGLLYYDKVMIGHAVCLLRSFPYSRLFKLTSDIGPFWHQARPRLDDWQSFLNGGCYLLPWIRHRSLPCYTPCPKISYRASCLWCYRGVGSHSDCHTSLHQLPWHLRTEIFPRLHRSWHQPDVHDDCRKCYSPSQSRIVVLTISRAAGTQRVNSL